MMPNKLLLFLMIALAIPAGAFAGSNKTGGAQTIMLDSAGSGGGAASGGAMKLYSSVGQASTPTQAAAGTYTLRSGFLAVIDETPPTVTFSTPAPASSQSGALGVAGTAADLNGVQWTLYYGPGASPSAWSQIASGSTSINAAALASWDTSGRSGAYTLKLVAVDGRGNTTSGSVTFNIGNTITVTGTIPAFKWVMMCLPNEPGVSDPISLFGSGEYKIFRWDPAASDLGTQGRYRYPATLRAGESYWIKSYYNDLSYSVQGSNVDTTGDYVISLKTGWNQIGTPFNRSYPMMQARVRHNGNTYDMATAAALGLISPTMQEFDSDSNSWAQAGDGYEIEPREGCFIRAYADVDLLLGPGTGLPGGLARTIRPVYDFKIKLSAAAGGSADNDNYLGTVNLAHEQFDAFDAEEPPRTPDDQFISLYFPRDAWSRNAGRYANDFRAPARDPGSADSWTFNVETNESGAAVTLTWDNASLPGDRYTFTLVNLDTGERIDMAERGSYSYPADGGGVSQSHFKIEVVRLASALVTTTHTLDPGWNLISVPIEPEVTAALTQLGDDLPLLNVYQVFDGKFYDAAGADIQAGVGYWVFVADNAEIDIVGTPVSQLPLTVPLKPGWNLIGNPFETQIAWDDRVHFLCNGNGMALSAAVAAGITDGALYEYADSGYTKTGTLKPWKGYMLKAAAACELLMNP